MIIEIATTDFESTKSAVAGGADRIELCANLVEGGVTPSYGVIKKCRELFDVKIYPIIRVRGGDLLYTDEEYECMYQDALMCKEIGTDGIVTGFLHSDGSIDVKRTSKIIDAVYPLGVTFHRAFDRCNDPFKAMEQLIAIGCERILTSGQQLVATDGMELIAELNKQSGNRIIIMPGSGVRASNIKQLAETTGCKEFHSSLRELTKTKMDFMAPAFIGDSGNDHYTVNAEAVRALRTQLETA
jgi:copper homeostasis protein